SSNDPGEGTATPASVTFTPANWSAPQVVTVTGQNDDVADGDQPYTIVTGQTVSTDLTYNGLPVSDVSVTNLDDETAGVIVSPTLGLNTTEEGGTANFTVVLRSQPTADVTIGVTSLDTTEGVASPSSLTFTSLNWNSPRTVTVTGQDDFVADGNQVYTVDLALAMSADPKYAVVDPANVRVTNIDNETPGFEVTPLDVV